MGARMAFDDPDGITVAGFFEADEQGQVARRDEGSPYQVFRDSTMKNVKFPFAKTTSKKVADAFGVSKMAQCTFSSATRSRVTCSRSASASSLKTSPSSSPRTRTTSTAPITRRRALKPGVQTVLSST